MNRKTIERLATAAKRGLTDAGFAAVKAEVDQRDDTDLLIIGVEGACPCGLGTSRIGISITHCQLADAHLGALERQVAAYVKRAGLAHIEHDKTEGRWE